MTALSLVDASKLSPDDLLSGLVEKTAHQNDLFKVMGFFRSPSPFGFDYLRLKDRPSAGAWINPGGSVSDSAATFEQVHGSLGTLIGDIKTPGKIQRLDGPKQQAVQMGLKASALAREFMDKMINGSFGTVALSATNVTGVAMAVVADWRGMGPDGGTGPRMPLTSGTGYKTVAPGSITCTVTGPVKTLKFRAPGDDSYGAVSVDVAAANPVVVLRSGSPNLWIRVKVTSASLPGATAVDDDVACTTGTHEPDGLVRLVDPGQLIDPTGANGDNCTPRKMRHLIHQCKAGAGTQKALFMNWRDLNDLNTEAITEEPGAQTRDLKFGQYGIESIPTFAGVPIFLVDDIGIAETCGTSSDASRVYCVALGLPGGATENDYPQMGPGLFGIYSGNSSATAEGRLCAGMFAEPVGPQEGSDNSLVRAGWDVGLANYYAEGLACMWGITPTP